MFLKNDMVANDEIYLKYGDKIWSILMKFFLYSERFIIVPEKYPGFFY